ncbi:hypothetical protein [Streptomyces sp. M1013]|uniref:hypothetical protein n=1 Tax=Streptomyces sp. M1013 TaxID=549798 RepID=UPI00117FE93A|nr:hypothetical protein [Streptomyces sp. M1013]
MNAAEAEDAAKAERVVRTVHEAATRALDRLEGSTAPADGASRAERDAQEAAFTLAVNEFIASVQTLLPVWADMISRPHYIGMNGYHPQVALGAFAKVTGDHSQPYTLRMLEMIKEQLGYSLAELDPPPPQQADAGDGEPAGSSGSIGARPSAGPSFFVPEHQLRQWYPFYEDGQTYADTAAGEQGNVTARPESDAAHANSDSEISGPYDDLREPWYRRLLGRNRGQR